MSPYEKLPERAFWKLAVANKSMFDISNLWHPKFHIEPEHRVVTYGSCFAQHIGRSLASRGYGWTVHEKIPSGMSAESARRFNYQTFSSRTGNIYTTSLLKQWTEWALGSAPVPKETWCSKDRWFDPFRPAIEPNGFASERELIECRAHTVECFRNSIVDSDFFVFTLGLTESWFNKRSGYEYPICPGTAAGEFDAGNHEFRNQRFDEILGSLRTTIDLMRRANTNLRFILTVSPVPLTATMSADHVLVATMHSKSVLRAVAGQLAAECDHVDYFPSYEIINSPVFRGAFFEPNQRSVNPYGVNLVMDSFFACLHERYGAPQRKGKGKKGGNQNHDVVCEEELLDAFSNT